MGTIQGIKMRVRLVRVRVGITFRHEQTLEGHALTRNCAPLQLERPLVRARTRFRLKLGLGLGLGVSVRVRMRDLREQLGGECVLAYRYEPLACDVVKVMVRLSVRLTQG